MSLRHALMGAFIVAAAGLPACLKLETTNSSGGTGGTGTSSGASGTSSSGGAYCEMITDGCDQCVMCALQFPTGPCSGQAYACGFSMPCTDISKCVNACVNDKACIQACIAMYPQGEMTYLEINNCTYCDECANACSALNLCFN